MRYAVSTESGRYEVVARRWWSRKDRKATRMAAKLLSHMEPQLAAEELRLQRVALSLATDGALWIGALGGERAIYADDDGRPGRRLWQL